MVEYSPNRRQVLAATGTALTVGLAGCSGGGDDGDSGPSDLDVPDEVQTWLDDEGANSADSVEDLTGQSSVTIENGLGSGNNFHFGPAVARISTGTTVTWEWVSDGHSCTSQQTPSGESFDAGINNEGHTFEQTFETAGNVLYFCQPHRSLGHVGALIVEE